MSAKYPNIYGRKGTRGLRPYLLAPKVLGVAAYWGGVLAATVLWGHHLAGASGLTPPAQLSWTPEHTRLVSQAVSTQSLLFSRLIIPAVAFSMAMGVLLLLQHPGIFFRQRWFQVKLLLLVLGAIMSHFWMRSRLHHLDAMLNQIKNEPATDAWLDAFRQVQWQYTAGLAIVLMGATTLVLLSRIKPRLGQNWGRDYPAVPSSATPSITGKVEP